MKKQQFCNKMMTLFERMLVKNSTSLNGQVIF